MEKLAIPGVVVGVILVAVVGTAVVGWFKALSNRRHDSKPQ